MACASRRLAKYFPSPVWCLHVRQIFRTDEWFCSHFASAAFSPVLSAEASLPTMDATQSPRMTMSEKALIRRLHFDQGKNRSDIARLLQRSLSSISRLLAQKKAPGELLIQRSDVAPSKPVQDFVHQLSCGRRSKGCPNPTPLVQMGLELALAQPI